MINVGIVGAGIQLAGQITVSIGVSSFKDQSPEDLISCAEAALAGALKKGGDGLEVFAVE